MVALLHRLDTGDSEPSNMKEPSPIRLKARFWEKNYGRYNFRL